MSCATKIAYAALICSWIQAQGCKRTAATLTATDLPGVYVCNLPGVVQTVELRADRTFVQAIGTGPERKTYDGRWSVVESGLGPDVTMWPYHFEWPSHLGPSGVGAWVAQRNVVATGAPCS